MYIYVYIYIYIEREREIHRAAKPAGSPRAGPRTKELPR